MPVSRLAPGAFAGVLVFGLAWFDGGFYAPAWGVASLGLLGVCGCAIVLSERLYLSRLALASVGGLFGLAAWTLMSGLWTSDLTKTVSDAELAFVYPIALTASLLVARRTGTSSLAIGTLAAMVAVCLYALGGRLAPDVFGFPNSVDAAGRLYSPIGYWNGLGAFAAMAALLGGGLAAARLPTAVRVGASASLVVTLVTLYLTFSRGALIAAAVGLVVLAVASPARLRLAATLTAALPWAAAAVLVVERRSQLTATTLHRQDVIDQGHGAIPLLIGCAVGAAATTLALTVLAPRVQVGATARRIIGAVLIVAIVLATRGRGGTPRRARRDGSLRPQFAGGVSRRPSTPTMPTGSATSPSMVDSTSGGWHGACSPRIPLWGRVRAAGRPSGCCTSPTTTTTSDRIRSTLRRWPSWG